MAKGTLRTLTIEIVQEVDDDQAFTDALNAGLAAMQHECREQVTFTRVASVQMKNPQDIVAGFGDDPLIFSDKV